MKRQKQTTDICNEHLRTAYPEQLVLVKDFIQEIEGVRKEHDSCSRPRDRRDLEFCALNK